MKKNIDGVMLTLKNPATGIVEDRLFPIGCTFTVDAEQIPDDNTGGVAPDTTFPTAVVNGVEMPLDVVIEPGKRYRVDCDEDEDGNVAVVYLDAVDEGEPD